MNKSIALLIDAHYLEIYSILALGVSNMYSTNSMEFIRLAFEFEILMCSYLILLVLLMVLSIFVCMNMEKKHYIEVLMLHMRVIFASLDLQYLASSYQPLLTVDFSPVIV